MDLTDLPLVSRLIARSCALKAAVVTKDEREGSSRALLNLGHSFGHAVEKLQNFCGWSHGEAVAFGIIAASRLAVRIGMMKENECSRIQTLIRKYGLPTSVSGLDPYDVYRAMLGDKKNLCGKMRLILPHCVGKCEIVSDVAEKEIVASIGECCD